MKKTYPSLLFLFVSASLFSQTIIKGTITSQRKEVLPGANIFLKDTYDGTTSDANGNYSFSTTETGKQILVASFVGYTPFNDTIDLSGNTLEINIILKEEFNELNAVVITAGAFEASDEKKSAVLRPLDIVTTAGAAGDIYGALQTLPGATQVGNDDGLYVRGGSDYETTTIIDGMPVKNPYYSTVPDVPSRGRFAPFLFKGTVFSTGGYSAEYGQALSSAVILESEDFPEVSAGGLSLSPIFTGGFYTHKFEKTAIGGGINYTNIGLYDALFKPRSYDVINSVQAYDGSYFFRQKTSKTGMIKVYGQIEGSNFGLRSPDVDSLAEGITDDILLRNAYNYVNASYKEIIGNNWTFFTGVSYSNNQDSILFDGLNVSKSDEAAQGKITLKNQLSEKASIKFGGEYQYLKNEQDFQEFTETVKQNYVSAFVESDIFITNSLAGRIGLRTERSDILDKINLAPRASIAYKTGKNSQVSFAYGEFYQTPQAEYLYDNYPYFTKPTSLTYEKATHYILNYQVLNNDRTFRIEGYYKKYEDLITIDAEIDGEELENNGAGYARGIDIFYRDKKTIKDADFWISYSFLDTKRKFIYYPIETQPTFAADHVLSVVYKHYIPKITTQVGATYRFISGFPYYDPFASDADFLKNSSPPYHNFSINASYLTTIFDNFTVVFVSVDNVLGFDQVYGYQYSAEDEGVYLEQIPPLKRQFFIGVFISITNKQTKEKLKELQEQEKLNDSPEQN